MDNWIKKYNKLFQKYKRHTKYWYHLILPDEDNNISDALEFIKDFLEYDTVVVYPVNPYKIIASFISKSEGPGLRLPSELFYKLPEYFGIEVIEEPQPLVSPPVCTTKY
ncbi:MAG: hypothetical protein DRP18_03340 [Candidatus Aenigmatarchaeota archaeon]|nr:MAG: hypothetical protein DRP18_03340 [Candidatus Aenigmarchaeota archaeon]